VSYAGLKAVRKGANNPIRVGNTKRAIEMSEEAAAEAVTDETVVEEVKEVEAVEAEAKTEETTESPKDDEATKVEASEPSPETEPEEKETDGFKKRIDDLTADIYELRSDRDRWRNEAQKPVPEPLAKETERTLESFEYDEAKFAAHNRDMGKVEAAEEYKTEAAKQTYEKQESDFRSKEAKYAVKHDDYYAVTNTRGLEISPALADTIRTSDMGPEVIYHLGKNLNMASKLSRMNYAGMMREVVKLEANLSVKPVDTSKAPKPAPKIDPVNEKVETGPGTSQESFEKWRAKYRKR